VTRHLLAASKRLPAGLVVAALWLLPRAALACPVCGGGQKPAVGRAYLYGAWMMSAIPPLAALGMAWFLRRRARTLAAPARPRAAEPVAVPTALRQPS